MRLEYQCSDKTGRFVVRNGRGRMLFETYNLNKDERKNLIEAIEYIRDTAYEEGLTCRQSVGDSIDSSAI